MAPLLKSKYILILIILLAALLRLPFLGQLPTGLTIDEAGQGYSAFSILKTGQDEWGDFLPLNPRGFGDYKPPLYMYLLVPSIAIFGLNEFAVRLPSAIAGILTILVFYFLVREMFGNKKLAVLASFFLAISPWHVYYSRLGWESNVGLLFFCLGIWLFLKGIQKPIWLIFSALSFGLSTLSYHSFKLLAPIIILSLAAIFFKQLKKINKKILIFSTSVLLIFILILGYGFVFSGAGRRASDQSFFKEENLIPLREIQMENKLPQPLGRILNNKYEFFFSKFADNYIGYYSLPFLFGGHRSDGSVLNFPGKGLLYFWQLPLLILGIFSLIKYRSKSGLMLLSWVIAAPIPASLTQDYLHAGRAQALYPALTIISSVGLVFLFKIIKGVNLKWLAAYALAAIIFITLTLRIDDYFFNTFNRPLGGLVQGYSQVIKFTESNKHKYNKIIFTKSHSNPQAYLAFYSGMNPLEFQQASQNWKSFEDQGFKFLDMTDYSLGKYEFKNTDFSRDRNEKNALIVFGPKEVPGDINTVANFNNQQGKPMFIVVDTNELTD